MNGVRLARYGFAIMTVLAAGVGLYALRFYGVLAHLWLGAPGTRAVIVREPVQALTHRLEAPVTPLVGPRNATKEDVGLPVP